MHAQRTQIASSTIDTDPILKGFTLIREHYEAERLALFKEKEELRIMEIQKLAAGPKPKVR